ncbi:MAG: hypothetical protein Q9170_005355 [Blastenia crenularia]
MNVPGSKESKWVVIWRKFALSALGIACPEILLSMAATQWVGARRCVRDLHSLDREGGRIDARGRAANGQEPPADIQQQPVDKREHQELSDCPKNAPSDGDSEREIFDMPMAFYADMGGFRLKLRDGESFPANARAITWLISEGLITQRLFEPLMIEDKNKVDILLRLITLTQICYFFVGVIARRAQNLFITTAELTTVSFIICSILTAFFWWHKPCDVLSPVIVDIDITAEELEKRFNPKAGYKWALTPLDWVTREEWWWSKVWWNYLNILRRLGVSFGSDTKPIDRIADTYQRPLPRTVQYTILVVTTGCFAVFFSAWHHQFPTEIELVFWRAVCITLVSILYIGLIISESSQAYDALQKRSQSWKWQSPTLPVSRWVGRSKPGRPPSSRSPKVEAILHRMRHFLEKIRNNSPDNDQSLRLPLKVIIPLYMMATLYWICRVFILLEDAIELRYLPKSAYATVDWQKFWPHLG